MTTLTEYGASLAALATPLTDEQVERAARLLVALQAEEEAA